MPLHVNQSTVWKQVQEVFVNASGTWKACTDVLVNSAGTWKSVLYTAGSQEYAAGSSGTFTVPAGVYSLTVSIIAGGGNGSAGDDYGSGGGGGGGYYQNYAYTVTPGQTLSYSVGNVLQNSTFGTLTCTAGGTPPSTHHTSYGVGGSPSGTNGQTGNQSNYNCPAIAGNGASSLWGTGGAGGVGGCPSQSGSVGGNASGYGAGGGGGGNNSSPGTGSAGRLWVSW